MNYKSKKARARAIQADVLSSIATLSDDELKNLTHELAREIEVLTNRRTALKQRIDGVRGERERRATLTTHGLHISDHAVMRYLERHKGVDVQAAREEIAAMAIANGWRDKHTEAGARAIDATTGIVAGFNGKTGVVTTILNRDEIEVIVR